MRCHYFRSGIYAFLNRLIIPLGIAAFACFYGLFRFAIVKWDLKTPGREDDDVEAEKQAVLSNDNFY